MTTYYKNSSDEIANVNFFNDNIVHVEASASAQLNDFLISTKDLHYLPTYQTKF